MVDSKIPILAQKHVSTILLFIFENGTVHKTDIVSVVHSNNSVDKLIEELKNEGFISVKKEFAGRNTYYISLTDKGISVTKNLKQAQAAAEGKQNEEDRETSEGIIHVDGEEINVRLEPEERKNSKYLKILIHSNVLDDHISVEEAIPGRPTRIFNIYIRQNGHGYFRLWCEEDKSFDCWHVKEAWTYPAVQKMMMEYKYKTKVCPYCKTVNDLDADYCKHCGAKLE
ncbi:hypothetical protein [Ferroplasma sp.]|uniref:hypothetical protein n=1 Tax=Ferroplasma sp. TaxID=2591003 RepID=UPI00260857BA|nr:hypothetical protein [Ferroplasma sp.]